MPVEDLAPDLNQAMAMDRATAALLGLALGDAMGMPSQTLDRQAIRRHYGRIDDFVDPFDGHPVSHGLVAGQVTDDTEQTILLARQLIGEPTPFHDACWDDAGWARDLLGWEQDVRRRGLLDLLGPSSKHALIALSEGVSLAETGKRGTTNGAAMRIFPVGIVTATAPLDVLVDHVEAVCRVTHNTSEAIAGAAAVAALVAEGVAGAGFADAIPKALTAARIGQRRGYPVGVPDMAARIEAALRLAERREPDLLADAIGTSVASHESVPAAFAIVRMAKEDPWQAALIAANIGGDTDTIAAMAAGMAAACRGLGSLPAVALERLTTINGLPMQDLAAELLRLSRRRVGAAFGEGALS